MYWNRLLSKTFNKALKSFPALLITGPRQSGKTTFLKHELKNRAEYVTFDDPLERQFACTDPRGFLQRFHQKRVILDEIQYVPELFSYLKMEIDQDRTSGKFIMTGSQQFQLMQNISDSLAGRIAVLELPPFSYAEVHPHLSAPLEKHLWLGGYPPVAVNPDSRNLWIKSYFQTYIERDIRQLQQIRDLKLFETYISFCAAHHSQQLNHAALSGKTGISQPTGKEWLSLLEASYITYTLLPYYNNYGKRLVKSGKIYFIDSSLAAYLTRQSSPESLWAGAMGGAFFEGWIISETVKYFLSRGMKAPIYYWRSHDGLEVDLIVENNQRLHCAEIKQTATPMPRHGEALQKFKKITGEKKCGNMAVICSVAKETQLPGEIKAINWSQLHIWLDSCIKE